MQDIETERMLKRGLPLFTVLAAALLVLTLGAILKLGSEIFVPIALAVLLSFVLAPLVRLLQKLYLPQSLAVFLTVVGAFGAIAMVFGIMGTQLASIATELPAYQSTIRAKVDGLSATDGPGGAFSKAIESFVQLGSSITESADSEEPTIAEAQRVVITEETGALGTIGLILSPLLHPLAIFVLVLVFVIFILAAREDLRNRFVRLVGTDDIQHTTEVIDDAARRLSRLFLTQLAVNSAYGVVIATALWLIGVPSPILWGILATITRFIPYAGAVIGAVPPLALAFAIDPGWSMLIMTALLFVIIEPIVGHVVEPLAFGHSTGLSPMAVVLAAAVWTFLWGPVGLVLATPLTVCLVVLGRHVPRLGFIGILLGESPALAPAEIFYQRMLANDPQEALAQARDFLRERSLATYYDEIALEALRLAHEDVARGRLTPERQQRLRLSTRALVAELGRIVADPRPRGGKAGTEAAAAVRAAGPDLGSSTEIVTRAELRPEWQGAAPVLCIAQPDSLDEIVAEMLAQVLGKHGIEARVLGVDRRNIEASSDALSPDIRMVCLSYMEPLSTLHLRHAVRLTRRFFAGASVVIGIWRERDRSIGAALGLRARADQVVPTIGSVLTTALAQATGKAEAARPAPRLRAVA